MPGRETTVTFLSELSDWLQLQYSIGYETWAERIKKETVSLMNCIFVILLFHKVFCIGLPNRNSQYQT